WPPSCWAGAAPSAPRRPTPRWSRPPVGTFSRWPPTPRSATPRRSSPTSASSPRTRGPTSSSSPSRPATPRPGCARPSSSRRRPRCPRPDAPRSCPGGDRPGRAGPGSAPAVPVAEDRGDLGEAAAVEDRALPADVGLLHLEEPVQAEVGGTAAGVPRALAELEPVVLLVRVGLLGGEHQGGQPGALAADDQQRPVLAPAAVLLVGDPGPDDLAGVGPAVGLRGVLQAGGVGAGRDLADLAAQRGDGAAVCGGRGVHKGVSTASPAPRPHRRAPGPEAGGRCAATPRPPAGPAGARRVRGGWPRRPEEARRSPCGADGAACPAFRTGCGRRGPRPVRGAGRRRPPGARGRDVSRGCRARGRAGRRGGRGPPGRSG